MATGSQPAAEAAAAAPQEGQDGGPREGRLAAGAHRDAREAEIAPAAAPPEGLGGVATGPSPEAEDEHPECQPPAAAPPEALGGEPHSGGSTAQAPTPGTPAASCLPAGSVMTHPAWQRGSCGSDGGEPETPSEPFSWRRAVWAEKKKEPEAQAAQEREAQPEEGEDATK